MIYIKTHPPSIKLCSRVGITHEKVCTHREIWIVAPAIDEWVLPHRFCSQEKPDPKKAVWTSRAACSAIRNLVEEAGGSFSCLEPSAQALVQATAKVVLSRAALHPNDPHMRWLVGNVPLLHAVDYDYLLLQVTEGEGECSRCEQPATC